MDIKQKAFQTAKQRFGNNFVGAQSYLRLEQALSASKTNYQFYMKENEGGNVFNTEVRLPLTDVFIAYGLQVFLGVPSSSTAADFKLLSYPNAVVMSTSGAAAAAETIYNGNMQITIDNVQYVTGWPMSKHRWVGTSQQRAQATDSPLIPQDEFYGGTTALSPVDPIISFSGSQKINISVLLPQSVATVQANSRLIMIWHGIQANNESGLNNGGVPVKRTSLNINRGR